MYIKMVRNDYAGFLNKYSHHFIPTDQVYVIYFQMLFQNAALTIDAILYFVIWTINLFWMFNFNFHRMMKRA